MLALDLWVPESATTRALRTAAPPVGGGRRSKRRARRALTPGGSRRKKKSRAQLAAAADPSNKSCPVTACVGESWWRARGLWALDTANANCWNSLVSHVLKRSKADFVLAQETKIYKRDAHAAAQREARRCGWNPSLGWAHPTAAAMGSGGTAVLSKKGMGIADLDIAICDSIDNRFHLAWADGICKRRHPLRFLIPPIWRRIISCEQDDSRGSGGCSWTAQGAVDHRCRRQRQCKGAGGVDVAQSCGRFGVCPRSAYVPRQRL